MTKLDWHHIIHVVHFLGVALLLAQPISSLIAWRMGPSRDRAVAIKFAELHSRMDRVALAGVGILIVSGFGQIWAHDIGPGDIFTDQVWLGIKITLVIIFVLTGALVSGPAIRARLALLRSAPEDGSEASALSASYSLVQNTGILMMLLILVILAMVIFHPFSPHGR